MESIVSTRQRRHFRTGVVLGMRCRNYDGSEKVVLRSEIFCVLLKYLIKQHQFFIFLFLQKFKIFIQFLTH